MKFKSLRERLAYLRELFFLLRRQEISVGVALSALVRPIDHLPTKNGASEVWIWDDVSRSEEMTWRDLNR